MVPRGNTSPGLKLLKTFAIWPESSDAIGGIHVTVVDTVFGVVGAVISSGQPTIDGGMRSTMGGNSMNTQW